MALHIFLFLFLLLPSLLEGLGLWTDRRIFLLYFSTFSAFFYIHTTSSLIPVKIPLKAGISYLLFLCFVSISTFFYSFDKQISFELLLFYYSCFLLFIFFYSYKKEGNIFIQYTSILLGVLFTSYSFLLPFFRSKSLSYLLPVFEKQFIFASFGGHNHLGDIVGLLVLILTYYLFQKKWVIFPFFVFFCVIVLISFSRSAYVSLFLVFIFMLFHFRKTIHSFLLPLFFLLLSMIMLTTYLVSIQLPSHSPFFNLQTYGKKIFKISPRDILSDHDIFLKQSLNSIQKHPLYGVGGGNFITASQYNSTRNVISDSAHSLFLELATEQGILATVCFLFFILFIVIQISKLNSLPGFLFLYLLFNFQTDYTYQVYSLFLIWIILASMSQCEEREISISPSVYGVLCIIPLVVFVCINTSTLLMKMNLFEAAIQWYPLHKEAYIGLIKQSGKNTPRYIKNALAIAPDNIVLIGETAKYFSMRGDKKKALDYYYSIYEKNNLCSFSYIKQIYHLKKILKSQSEADYFLNRVVSEYSKIFATNSLRKEFEAFCNEEKMEDCPRIGWNRK